MTTTVKLKRSETGSSVPTTSDIVVGEVALNTADQKIYVRDSSNNIKVIGVGADATTSIKGIASFSSSNFTVSSGAVSLNADQSGTITGLGTITTGVWNGTAIGSQYGGTGQDFSSSTGVTYFDSGTASTVSMATKGQLLVGDGSGAPQTLSVGTNDYVLTADSTTGTGVAWKAASGGGDSSAAKNMFFFTASTGQTTFTGTDDDGTTLSYNAGTGKTNIYLNGILLDDADYTASNGTSVVLSTAAAANDLLTVEAFVVSSTFELSNDATPQLGGTLDLNGNDITGTGDINTTGNLTISGNLTVNGTTTTVNSTTLTIDDKNIELASTASPSDTTADGGGITLKGDTDHTFNWVNSTDAWTSSEHLDLATGKEYKINGTSLKDVTETLTNKTINSASNTITITESNISDLGSYLENIVEDTTPQLGGDLDTQTNTIDLSANTASLKLNKGTTAQRDGSPISGMLRFNTEESSFEGYDGSAWGSIGGGASAGGAIYENTDSISADYTITSGTNGFSVGPMTIASGVTVTVPSGQRWVIL